MQDSLPRQHKYDKLGAMKTNYLHWYNDLHLELQGRTDAHLLLSSSVSEPTELLRQHVQQFSSQRAASFQHLSPAWEHPALVANIAERYGMDERNIVTTNGVSNGIYLICRALLDEQSHVIIESPVYEPLVASPEFIGSEISYVRRRPPAYQIDPEAISHAVKPHTRLIVVSNPHNPSGACLADDALIAIAAQARAVNPAVMVVVDEVYHDFVADRQPPAAALDNCFVSLNSLTKVYGLGCLHCGWIIAPKDVVAKVRQLQMLVEGSYARLLEAISAYVLARLDQYLQHSKAAVERNRPLMRECAAVLVDRGILAGSVPDQGCIYFPEVSVGLEANQFPKRLAGEYGVYVVPGRFFGEPRHVRIGFGGPSDSLATSLQHFTEACCSLVNK